MSQLTSRADGVLVVALCLAATVVLLWLMARRRRAAVDEFAGLLPADRKTRSSACDSPVFYGLQPRWTRFDCFFKVYVTPAALHGAWIGGQFHDDVSVRIQLGAFGPLVLPVITWVRNRRRTLELMYDLLICDPVCVLRQDTRNFVIQRSEIQTIRIIETPAFWTTWQDQGSHIFELCSGKTLTLIIRDEKDARTVGSRLAALGFPVLGA
jgi:hypothetical protein